MVFWTKFNLYSFKADLSNCISSFLYDVKVLFQRCFGKSKLKLYFITCMSEVCVMEEQTELTLEAIGGQNQMVSFVNKFIKHELCFLCYVPTQLFFLFNLNNYFYLWKETNFS